MIRRIGMALAASAMVLLAMYSYAAEPHQQMVVGYKVPVAPVTGPVPATAVIHLAIGLPPRDAEGLRALANAVSDPKSSQFRHFLTHDQLTERFGPSAADYQALIKWAQTNHLTVEAQYPHRLLLGVKGQAADVEQALAVKLSYAKRPDGTTFYKPDRAPSLDLGVKVSHIAGVDNLFVPRHHGGSQVNGYYGSSDLRNAYAGNCLGLTGAGESVGIMSYWYYNPQDITSFETAVGIGNASTCGASTPGSAPCINNNQINNYQPPAGADALGTAETTADIELAITMAPGLKQVEVFQADGNTGCTAGDSILAAWLAATNVQVFSSSTGYCLEGNDVSIIQEMGAAGQSFFASSGDNGTGYTLEEVSYPPPPHEAEEPNFNTFSPAEITPVGGTVLAMNGNGASYNYEQAWLYSGGGVESLPAISPTCTPGCTPGAPGCSDNCIPSYQAGVANAQNQASSTYRNDPDIAMPAMNVFTVIGGVQSYFCGTSASSPLMAGFMALADQQECLNSPSNCARGLGFVSPSLYAIGFNAATYATSFNDVIGNSTDATTCGGSGSSAPAVAGYDLSTGWGSPKCGLIDQLSCTTCSGTTASAGTLPSTSCVSFQSDSNNCGSCGNVCGTGFSCQQGRCQAGHSHGETHLVTFDGMLYNFQASGEFVLAKAGSDFVVQTRQVSAAPHWTNVTFNTAVATRMGKTTVALCLKPKRLLIDGKPHDLADRQTLSLPDGVSVTHNGAEFVITRQDGEIVQATLNETAGESWIDVSVGLGHSAHGAVSGLLGNANGNTADDIWPRNATKALAQPVSFDDLYNVYGKSWVVEPDDSMLCGDKYVAYGIPSEPFYAKDLPVELYARAKEICNAAGVKDDALLDACMLDVTVFNTPLAAKVFTRLARPVATLLPVRRAP
jgi:subtilase family serine protease